jgi:large conductance mechanosensitive channel
LIEAPSTLNRPFATNADLFYSPADLVVSSCRRTFSEGRPTVLEEFKKFAMRGNVVDLAVGVIIGAAFGAIVNSLVTDLIMPLIGAITGGLDFSNYFVPLAKNVTAASYVEAKKQGAVLGYGQFITIVINFAIIAFVLFLAVRGINRLQAPPKAPEAPADVKLLTEIRDLLAKSPR